ncbi:hypothetical protein [Stenotrophomonas maltophilia]|uniref:hypothetical protein n=1 Tax=Stenotrophomonas maltophilia TaxID=40324 RepID=UPI0039C32C3D
MISSNASNDPFRPRHEPARFIYDALTAEQAHRKGREFEVWNKAEINAVYEAAKIAFERADLPIPTLADVQSAERYARGSIDYGATWVYALTNATKKRKETPAA